MTSSRIDLTGPSVIVYQDRFVTVDRTPVTFPNGAGSEHVRVNPGMFGGVAVPRAVVRGIPYFGLVRQHRFAIDKVTLESPQGPRPTCRLRRRSASSWRRTASESRSAPRRTSATSTRTPVW